MMVKIEEKDREEIKRLIHAFKYLQTLVDSDRMFLFIFKTVCKQNRKLIESITQYKVFTDTISGLWYKHNDDIIYKILNDLIVILDDVVLSDQNNYNYLPQINAFGNVLVNVYISYVGEAKDELNSRPIYTDAQ